MRTYQHHFVGERRGNLTLIERMPGGQKWRCRCDCGNETIIQVAGGPTCCPKCSLARTAKAKTTHGKSGHWYRLYRIWDAMRCRCNDPRNKSYGDYGARGISVCQKWDDFTAFESWALSHGYADGLTIDRIDNNGNYCPENCAWHTQKQQMRNTRMNHFITINGQSKCVVDWCGELHIFKTNAYVNAKEIGISVDDYLTFKYFNRAIPCTRKNFDDWELSRKEKKPCA